MLNLFYRLEIIILLHSFQIKSQISMISNKVSVSMDTSVDVTAETLKYFVKPYILIINRTMNWAPKNNSEKKLYLL